MIVSLLQASLFRGLRKDQLVSLLEKSTAKIRHYERGDFVAHAGDEVVYLHLLLSGSTRGEMIDFTGKVIKIEDIQVPRPLAPAFLFGTQNRYPVNIIANEKVQILSIPRESFIRMMQQSEQLLRNFVDNISNRGQFLSNKIRFLSFSTIKGKLAQYLIDLSGKQQSDRVMLPHSQSQLSELFGVARPSVGRAVSEMNQKGLIRAEGRKIQILDKRGLQDLLHE